MSKRGGRAMPEDAWPDVTARGDIAIILCLMRVPPDPDGHGASQRAWYLLRALAQRDAVHFVLLHRETDRDAATTSLDALRPFVASITSLDVPEWEPTGRKRIGLFDGRWLDVARMGSQEAPRISAAGLRRIAEALPVRSASLLFAGRLPTAVIADALMERGLLTAGRRFACFDDLMSRLRRWQLDLEGPLLGRQGRALLRFDIHRIRAAERRITGTWDGVSVSSAGDRDVLKGWCPDAAVAHIPNVIHREPLAAREGIGPRLLFVGNLGYEPNAKGLDVFVRDAWPAIRTALPGASLDVVGMNPGPKVRALAASDGIALHVDPPSVQPFYAASDMAVVPILFGGGTRIKILEAMAYGRPVVTTAAGAEGLGLESGRHAVVVPDMNGFAEAVVALARDGTARRRLVSEARAYQARTFGPEAMERALGTALDGASSRSRRVR